MSPVAQRLPLAYRSVASSRFDPPDLRPSPRRTDLAICLILAVAIVGLLMMAL